AVFFFFFFFQAEDGIRDRTVTGVQTCALPISRPPGRVAPPAAQLDPAVEAGVVEFTADGTRFTHPLLAEAAVGLLGPAELRAIRLEIAARAPEPEQRVRQLAHAADGPDETLAAALADAADTAARRGASAAAAELWELAAAL